VTDPTARNALALLEKAAIVREITGRTWGKMYLAHGVLKAIEHPKEQDA
jgi:hypothetical protein